MARPAARKQQTAPGYAELRAAVKKGDIARLYVLSGEETFLMERFLTLLEQALIRPESVTLDKVSISPLRIGRLSVDRVRAEVMTPPFMSARRLVIVRQTGWFAPERGARDGEDDSESGEQTANAQGTSSAGASDEPSAAFAPEPVSGAGKRTASSRATPGTRAPAARGPASVAEDLIALFGSLPDSACLVFCEQKVDKRLKSLMAAIEQAGTIGSFEPEQPATLIQWIDAECRHRGLRIDAAAAASLVDRCDGSMLVIWNELAKLFLYMAGSGSQTIGMPILETLSLPDLRGSIFDLTDAISTGRTAQALTLLDTLIAQKQPVQLITFMLARHFRQLIVARSLGAQDQIASRLKVMPFVAARLLNQSRGLDLETLEAQYLACFEADLSVKTGRIGDRLALETLLVSAAESAKRRKGGGAEAAAGRSAR